MQYVFVGDVLNVDMEDAKEVLTFDMKKANPDTLNKFLRLGVRTKIRNYTAGKQGSDARKAVVEGIASLYENRWGAESAGKVTLSEDELKAIGIDYMVKLKLLSGDKRSAEAITAAFTALPAARQTELFAQNKRAIKKAQSDALDAKKGKTKAVVAWEG